MISSLLGTPQNTFILPVRITLEDVILFSLVFILKRSLRIHAKTWDEKSWIIEELENLVKIQITPEEIYKLWFAKLRGWAFFKKRW